MLADLSLYYKNGQLVSDAAVTIGGALLAGVPGATLATNVYAPASQTSLTMTGTTNGGTSLAAFDSTHVNTGGFTAPPSGNVLVIVTAGFKAVGATNVNVVGLCAHGTVTPVVGNTVSFQTGAANATGSYMFRFYVTGLTPASSYNFDLVGAEYTASTAAFTLVAYGNASNPPTGSAGMPVVITVQAA